MLPIHLVYCNTVPSLYDVTHSPGILQHRAFTLWYYLLINEVYSSLFFFRCLDPMRGQPSDDDDQAVEPAAGFDVAEGEGVGWFLPPCELCPIRGGALKRTVRGGKWCHVECALWMPRNEVAFEKPDVFNDVSITLDPDRCKLRCRVCGRRGGAVLQVRE